MDMLKRFLASLTAGSLAFSAVPALAEGISVTSHADASLSLMLNRCKRMEGDDRAECERRVRLQLEANTGTGSRPRRDDSHGGFVSGIRKDAGEHQERLWNKAVAAVEQMIKRVGSAAKKVCRAEHEDTAAVTACVSALKTSFQTSVNAAITAAFSL